MTGSDGQQFNPLTGDFDPTFSFWAGRIGGFVISLATLFVVWILRIGLLRAALGATRGEMPSTSDLTEPHNTRAYMLTTVVVAATVSVGSAPLRHTRAAGRLLPCVLGHPFPRQGRRRVGRHEVELWGGQGQRRRRSRPDRARARRRHHRSDAPGVVRIVLIALAGLAIEPIAALMIANIYRKLGGEQVAAA